MLLTMLLLVFLS